MNNVLQLRPQTAEFMCSSCGVDAGCNCGAPLVSKAERAAAAIAANPGKSDRAIASEIGSSPTTVGKARSQLSSGGQLNDHPAHGFLDAWNAEIDRQEETRVGKDGKERRMPTKKVPDQNKEVNEFCNEALEFIADFDHRFRVWFSQNQPLGSTEKTALISSIQSCADGMSSLAQSLR